MVKLIEVKDSDTRKPLVVELSVDECQAIRDMCGYVAFGGGFREVTNELFVFLEENGYNSTETHLNNIHGVHND